MKLVLAFDISEDDYVMIDQASKMFNRSINDYVRDSSMYYTKKTLASRNDKLVIDEHTRIFYNGDGKMTHAYGVGKAKDFKKKSGDEHEDAL
jgi:hypothetical protein